MHFPRPTFRSQEKRVSPLPELLNSDACGQVREQPARIVGKVVRVQALVSTTKIPMYCNFKHSTILESLFVPFS